jgi:hypothetical protein
MADITAFVVIWAESVWGMLVDSAFLLLIGIVLGGFVHILLHAKSFSRLLRGSKVAGVFKAALFGVPLPLCSCSVVPLAYQLRKSGLSKGGTVAFLISTPETGVDSILLTYSLTDPLLTIARPLTAFLTAAAAGLTEIFFDRDDRPQVADNRNQAVRVCTDGCQDVSGQTLWSKGWSGLKYAFTDLLGDLAPYLLFGYLLAGLVGAVLGADLYQLPESLRSGLGGYVGALVIGLPLYICATSSTPLAAALLAAGFSPGAMLVFMMVGPATNIASLVVVGRFLKRWALVRYLLIIVIVAFLAGLMTDWLYRALDLSTSYRFERATESVSWLSLISAAVLALLILYHTVRRASRA